MLENLTHDVHWLANDLKPYSVCFRVHVCLPVPVLCLSTPLILFLFQCCADVCGYCCGFIYCCYAFSAM